MTKLATLLLLGVSTFSFGQNNPNQREFKINSSELNSVETFNVFKTTESLLFGRDYKIIDDLNVEQDSSIVDYFNITDYQSSIETGETIIVIPNTNYRIVLTAKEAEPTTIINKN